MAVINTSYLIHWTLSHCLVYCMCVVPLTTAVPQMPSVLGQPPPFHLLPGSSSLGGLSGTTGVIGDSLGGFGTRSHHQSSG